MCVQIASGCLKRIHGLLGLSGGQQVFRLRIVNLGNPLLCILIVAQNPKRDHGFLILPGGKQVLRRTILAVGNDDLSQHNSCRDCNHDHHAHNDADLLVLICPGLRFLLSDDALPLGLRHSCSLERFRSLTAQRCQRRTVPIAIQMVQLNGCLPQLLRICFIFSSRCPLLIIGLTAPLGQCAEFCGLLIRLRKMGSISFPCFFLCLFIRRLALLDPLIQEPKQVLLCRFELLGYLALGKLLRTDQLLVVGPVIMFFLAYLSAPLRYGLIVPVKLV